MVPSKSRSHSQFDLAWLRIYIRFPDSGHQTLNLGAFCFRFLAENKNIVKRVIIVLIHVIKLLLFNHSNVGKELPLREQVPTLESLNGR